MMLWVLSAALADDVRTTMPEPLPPRPFVPTPVERATLSNGLEVVVATNTEVPVVDLEITFASGAYADGLS